MEMFFGESRGHLFPQRESHRHLFPQRESRGHLFPQREGKHESLRNLSRVKGVDGTLNGTLQRFFFIISEGKEGDKGRIRELEKFFKKTFH